MIYFLVGYMLGKCDNGETETEKSVRRLLENLSTRGFRQEIEESLEEEDAPTIQMGPERILEGCPERFISGRKHKKSSSN